MRRSIPVAQCLALCLALTFGAAPAGADGRSQILLDVRHELPNFVPGVAAEELSTHQLASIRSVIHGPGSHSDKISSIRSILGGPYSLRRLFFN